MLALWARAARNPGSCRCISCVSNTTAVSRRAGAINLPGFATFGTPTSTFVYTAIFAAGLTIDAKAKKNRNKEWDALFANMRKDMARLSQEEAPIGPNSTDIEGVDTKDCTPIEELLSENVNWDLVHQISGTDLVEEELFEIHQTALELGDITDGLWNLLAWDSRHPGTQVLEWPANTGRDVVPHHLPPQSLWSLDHIRLAALRRRHNWKKFAMQELSPGLLIHSLIDKADLRGPKDKAWKRKNLFLLSPGLLEVVSFNEDQTRNARLRILDIMENLHREQSEVEPQIKFGSSFRAIMPAIPHYSQDDNGDFHNVCQQMNITIRKLLHYEGNRRRDDIESQRVLAKICHNLLVSTAPPDVQTFNILLAGFKKWRRPDLVDAVIPAVEACKIRPNELTCMAILGHYIAESRPDAFSRFVGKMRGVEDALMLARPDVNINEASQGRLIRAGEGKVYQLVYPTPVVFNILLGGVLKFAGFERALDIYYEMKSDGWGLDMLGLVHFLGDCIKRADWNGGLYIWEEINNIKHRAKPKHMAKAYSEMLSLCSVTGNTVAFNQLLKEVVGRGFDQRAILRSAEETTHWAKKRGKWDKLAPETPAWIADNVLIAVSSYIEDAQVTAKYSSSPERANARPTQTQALRYDEDDTFSPETSEAQSKTKESVAKDPEAIWASWIEHELGEKPRKP